MNENEKKTLFDRYVEMPEEELTEMLAVDESEYGEGVFPILIEAAKSRGFATNKDEIIKKATSAEKEKAIFSEQRWKESSRSFYRKIGLILCIAWILLTTFLFLVVPGERTYLLPVISLSVCAKWFILVWLIRITVYKHFIWKPYLSKSRHGQ